jgi:predicted dehydrogenase
VTRYLDILKRFLTSDRAGSPAHAPEPVSSGQPRLRCAVVGVGYLGRFHAQKYLASPAAELVALVDPVPANAEAIARTCGAMVLHDCRELAELGLDCASVVTPTTAHFEAAAWLLENGVDVLLEKPMTATVAEARRLIEIAESRGRILQIGHIERFDPVFQEMKRVLVDPRFFEVQRIAPFKPRAIDVDVVLDLMVHDVDLVAHFVGRPIVNVEAVGVPVLTKTVDIANVRLTFEGGAVANLTASRAGFKTERVIRIFQPDAYIKIDLQQKNVQVYRRGAASSENGFPEISMVTKALKQADALADEIASFLACVRDRMQPEVTAADGLRALEVTALIRAKMNAALSGADNSVIRAVSGG